MQAPSRDWPLDLTRVGLLLVAAVTHGAWVVSIAQSHGTAEFSRRDWWAFRDAGRRVLDGDLAGLYDARPGGFPFLHPPYVAAVLAPAGHLGDVAYYGSMVALQLLGLAAAWLALRRLHPTGRAQDVVLLGALASAPWAIGLLLGQPSALLLCAWLVALLAIERDRPLAAGVLLGLCALKPMYVVAPILYALLRGRRRILAGIVLAASVLFVLSLLVGHWGAWLAAISRTLSGVGAAELTLFKQHTLLATLRGVLPRTPALVAWGVVTLASLLRLYALRRATAPKLRVLGWLALGTIALSPFAHFYDAILLVLPAAALWLCRESYRPWLWVTIALVVGLTFAAQHVEFFVVQGGAPVVGALSTLWLWLELSAPPASSDRVEERGSSAGRGREVEQRIVDAAVCGKVAARRALGVEEADALVGVPAPDTPELVGR